MDRVGQDVTLDQIDAWFQIGKEIPKTKTVTRSKCHGRMLDPQTGEMARLTSEQAHTPNFKRHSGYSNTSQLAYAERYKAAQDESLVRQQVPTPQYAGDASHQFGGMEGLEEDTMSMISTPSQVQLPEDMTEMEANKVYAQYGVNKPYQYDPKLPITKFREELIQTIESNQVTVIEGPTGSGKTTQVPQYILDHYASMNKYCNIIVTQPRRIAAQSIARRVCEQRDWEISRLCGYAIGRDHVFSEHTRLLYVTTEVLLQKLINTKNMLQFTHVILDEVHDRETTTDFCMLVVKKFLQSNSQHVKVVLMSATIQCDLFADYFKVPVRNRLDPAPIVSVTGRQFSVSEFYIEDLKSLGPMPYFEYEKPEISDESYDIALQLIVVKFDEMDRSSKGQTQHIGVEGIHTRGSVLIFLPGLYEIHQLEERLRGCSARKKLTILPLHSSITAEEQRKVFDKPQPFYRKIILSTNIAESSITVADIAYVIDFCLTKHNVLNPETNLECLQLDWASKANCKQRQGRAGRVQQGRVYRMVPKRFYRECLKDFLVPEMQRCHLGKVVLQTKKLDIGEPKAILGVALSPPNLDDIERTILILKEMGALSSLKSGMVNPHDGELTFLGRVLATLPVDIHHGKLIVMGHAFGMLDECLTIAAALALPSLFAKPYNVYMESYLKRVEWASDSGSDCIALLNAYQRWKHMKNTGGFQRANTSETLFAHRHFLQMRNIRDVDLLRDELAKRMSEFNIQVPRRYEPKLHLSEENQLILKMVMCAAFYPNYFVNDPCDQEEANRMLSGKNPQTTVMVKGLPQNQGSLYKDRIQTLFRCCQIEKPARVLFEETRAYIEFSRTKKESYSNKALQAVYLAVKLRNLRIPLTVEIIEGKEAQKQLKSFQNSQDEEAKKIQRLRSNRIKAESDGALGATSQENFGPQQVAPPGPHESTVVPLYVTEILDCGHFWAHYGDDDTWEKMDKLHETINKHQGRNLQRMQGEINPGTLCLAPFTDGHTRDFYRARVNYMKSSEDDKPAEAEVFFVDYGNVEDVKISDLKEIDPCLLTEKYQAFECQLCKVKPSSLKSLNGRWSNAAVRAFGDLVRDKRTLRAQVFSIVHGVLRVDLYEKLQGEHEAHINEIMISMGYADEADESYLSLINHEKRMEEAVSDRTAMPVSPQSALTEGWFTQRLHEDSNYTYGGASSRPSKIRLKGPWSPLEMTFHSMTYVGKMFTVRIDTDSVNSVCLNDNPEDKCSRLLVAGYVGQSADQSAMKVRESTFLPAIPGLPHLAALLFAPTAEIRADPERKRYIGAICGLGWDFETGKSAFPDHDLEVVFDTEFTQFDLEQVNRVRMAIDLATDSESDGEQKIVQKWSRDYLKKVQKEAKDSLLALLQKRKKTVEPEHYMRPYAWHEVAESDLIRSPLEDSLSCPMLNLHSAVALQSDQLPDDETPEEATQRERSEMIRHVEELKKKASLDTHPQENTCLLCMIRCLTPRDLKMHLCTMRHQHEESKLDIKNS